MSFITYIIPTAAGTYFIPRGTRTAVSASSGTPTAISLSNGTWDELTKTLSSVTAGVFNDLIAGDWINVTGGTGVTNGAYKVASKTSGTAIVLATSPSTAKVALSAGNIAADSSTTASCVKDGYLRNPARNELAGDGGSVFEVAYIGELGGATDVADSLGFADQNGASAVTFALRSTSKPFLYSAPYGCDGFRFQITAGPCIVTTGASGFLLQARNLAR
jgi:hypothetical protein